MIEIHELLTQPNATMLLCVPCALALSPVNSLQNIIYNTPKTCIATLYLKFQAKMCAPHTIMGECTCNQYTQMNGAYISHRVSN